jgi:hypothetical protein
VLKNIIKREEDRRGEETRERKKVKVGISTFMLVERSKQ